MRISDWSSDVCSSDLERVVPASTIGSWPRSDAQGTEEDAVGVVAADRDGDQVGVRVNGIELDRPVVRNQLWSVDDVLGASRAARDVGELRVLACPTDLAR